MTIARQERVIAYIDGFNLYFGLRESRLKRFLWLDLQRLSINLLRPSQTLVFANYFTSRISGPARDDTSRYAQKLADKRKRQLNYLEALGTLTDLRIHYGQFLEKQAECFGCGNRWIAFEEKMTDVNIAVEMLTDAHQGRFDTALLVSADSDLVGPINAIRRLFPDKRVVAAFPPGRSSVHVRQAASAAFIIGRGKLSISQLPDQVPKPDGYLLRRPPEWQ